MFKQIILPVLGVAAFIVVVGLFIQKSPKVNLATNGTPIANIASSKKITVGDTVIPVEVVMTPEERTKGLSGRESLEANKGMLFIFDTQNVSPIFWMKDMKIAIDIVWIGDGKVVKIDKNVPAPAPGTQDKDLKLYTPGSAIDYVLEVNAGFSDQNGLKVGENVDLSNI